MKKTLKGKVSLFFVMLFVAFFISEQYHTFSVKAADNVVNIPSPMHLNYTSQSIVKDNTFSLKIYNVPDNHKVTYKSNTPSIASVDKDGVVTANKVGTATISVIVKDGFRTIDTLQCEITVGPPAISIKFTQSEVTLLVDKKISLKTILKPNNTVEEPRFSSNNTEVAIVNSRTGRVTAKSPGQATITVVVGDNKYDYCVIVVLEAPPEDPSSNESEKEK